MCCGQKNYPDQASVLTQRSLEELLLFATVGVKNSVYRRKLVELTNQKDLNL